MTAAFGVCPAEAIAAVIEACKDGAKVVDLCKIGDDVINKCVCSSCCLQQELLLLLLLLLWTQPPSAAATTARLSSNHECTSIFFSTSSAVHVALLQQLDAAASCRSRPQRITTNTKLGACRECAKSFKGKQIEKGVAFPTCVSPNRCVKQHCSSAAIHSSQRYARLAHGTWLQSQ
jgi:hypothetical protein